MAGSDVLEKYDGQSLDELIALESRCRIDSLVMALEEALRSR